MKINQEDLLKVNRVEIIDHTKDENDEVKGRSYVKWEEDDFKVEADLQDNYKTLKIFIYEDTNSGE